MFCAHGSTIYYTLDGSIPFSKEEMVNDFPKKLDTKIYTEPIHITDRKGEEALLATIENTPLFYDLDLEWDGQVYYPTAEQLPKGTVIRAMLVDADGKEDVNFASRLSDIREFINERKAEIKGYIQDSFGLEVEG